MTEVEWSAEVDNGDCVVRSEERMWKPSLRMHLNLVIRGLELGSWVGWGGGPDDTRKEGTGNLFGYEGWGLTSFIISPFKVFLLYQYKVLDGLFGHRIENLIIREFL